MELNVVEPVVLQRVDAPPIVTPPGTIHVVVASPEPPDDVPLWGLVQLDTPRRRDAFNVILIEGASPYGSWAEVTMMPEMGVTIGAGDVFRTDAERGRKYRAVVRDPARVMFYPNEVVVALNWKALYARRPMPGQYGRTVYTQIRLLFSEEPLDFEGRLDGLIGALVDHATG